jgi:hypothetical protein
LATFSSVMVSTVHRSVMALALLGAGSGQVTVQPPSTVSTWPVTARLSSLHR